MKLTRDQLIRASNKQLEAIGLRRDGNKGWMEKALARDWLPEEMERLHCLAPVKSEPPPILPPKRPRWTATVSGPDGSKFTIEADSKRALFDYLKGHFSELRSFE